MKSPDTGSRMGIHGMCIANRKSTNEKARPGPENGHSDGNVQLPMVQNTFLQLRARAGKKSILPQKHVPQGGIRYSQIRGCIVRKLSPSPMAPFCTIGSNILPSESVWHKSVSDFRTAFLPYVSRLRIRGCVTVLLERDANSQMNFHYSLISRYSQKSPWSPKSASLKSWIHCGVRFPARSSFAMPVITLEGRQQ